VRHIRALVFSLSLTSALAGSVALAPAAHAQDPALKSARDLVEKAEKLLAEQKVGDPSGANAVISVNNQAIQRLNSSSRKGTPEWKELADRAKATDKAARDKAAGKPEAPPAAPTPPAGGAPTEGSSGAAPTPAAPTKPGELEFSGEPNLAKFQEREQAKFTTWKGEYSAIWKKLAESDPIALAEKPDAQKRAYEEALSKIQGAFRSPGQFTATCNPFIKKKGADFWAYFEARMAEGKSSLESARASTDAALTKALADADALDAEIKALKSGDKDAGAKLESKRAALVALLETSTAKLNPSWKKTSDRAAVMKDRIDRRAAGQADDPSLGVDLSDAPFDGLTKYEQDGMEKWKGSFTRALKAMCAWDDVKLAESNQVDALKGDIERARGGSVGTKGLNPAIYAYIDKKDAEYLAILDGKLKNGQAKLAGAEADRAAMREKAKGILVSTLAELPAYGGRYELASPWTDAQLEAWASDIRKWKAKLAWFEAEIKPVEESFGHQIMRKDDPRFGDSFGSFPLKGCGREVPMNDHLWFFRKELPDAIAKAVEAAEREGNWERTIKAAQDVVPEHSYVWDSYPPAGDENVKRDQERLVEGTKAAIAQHKFRQALAGKPITDDMGAVNALAADFAAKGPRILAQKVKAISEARIPAANDREPELRAIAEKVLPDTDYGAKAWDKGFNGFEKLILLSPKDTKKSVEWKNGTLYNDDYDVFKVATIEKRGDEYFVYKYRIGFARSMTSVIHHGTKAPINKWFIFPQGVEYYRILKENLDKPPRE